MRPELGYRQTDINGHITNCAYIDWILSSFSNDFQRAHMPSDLEIIFYHETLESDVLELITMPDPGNPGWFIHEVHRLHAAAADGEKAVREIACRARTAWKTREELS
jgi:acyl-ACP thioesterase